MKKEIIVYRIEHRKVRNDKNNYFCGPYGISDYIDASEWADSDHDDDVDTKPSPCEDELLFKNINKKRKLYSWHKEFIYRINEFREPRFCSCKI